MAVSSTQTRDLAQVLVDLVAGVPDLRAYAYVADTVRPAMSGGAAVVGQPEIDYTDNSAGFCSAAWLFPVTVVVARNNDRDAQMTLSRLLLDIVTALAADVENIVSIEPQNARPIPVTVAGAEYPGYLLTIRIRA
jgi:hypothetical protein